MLVGICLFDGKWAVPIIRGRTGDGPRVPSPGFRPFRLATADVDARHRRITFESTGITTKRRTGAALDLVVAGRLTIPDVTQPVTAPVHVEVANGQLIASGRFAIKQTAFGIKPISVGGVVAVKDTLDIAFSIAARP